MLAAVYNNCPLPTALPNIAGLEVLYCSDCPLLVRSDTPALRNIAGLEMLYCSACPLLIRSDCPLPIRSNTSASKCSEVLRDAGIVNGIKRLCPDKNLSSLILDIFEAHPRITPGVIGAVVEYMVKSAKHRRIPHNNDLCLAILQQVCGLMALDSNTGLVRRRAKRHVADRIAILSTTPEWYAKGTLMFETAARRELHAWQDAWALTDEQAANFLERAMDGLDIPFCKFHTSAEMKNHVEREAGVRVATLVGYL